MDDRPISSPLLLTSRCRLTLKGRLHMDPALAAGSALDSERGVQLNATAHFVLERCDGLHSVGDLARELAQAWRVPEAQVASDVLAFLEALRRQDYVHVEDSSEGPM